MNVYDNIAFGLKIKKFSDKEIQKRVGAMLELVNLKGFENAQSTDFPAVSSRELPLQGHLSMSRKCFFLTSLWARLI